MFINNKIYKIDKNGKKKRIFWVKGLKIRFKGKNSTVILHEPVKKFKNCLILCGNNCLVDIDTSIYKRTGVIIHATANNSVCKIGKNFSCTNGCTILLHKEPNLSVTIDENCMFGTNVLLRTTDAHTIYNVNTNETENYGASIKIGKHCWLAMNTTVLKGVNIADNCIIATNSTVTKDCTQNESIYAGLPAKIVKTGVNWERKSPSEI